jgi:hypothetical protein
LIWAARAEVIVALNFFILCRAILRTGLPTTNYSSGVVALAIAGDGLAFVCGVRYVWANYNHSSYTTRPGVVSMPTLNLRKFDMSAVEDTAVILYIGKRRSGISYALRDIPVGTVISPSESGVVRFECRPNQSQSQSQSPTSTLERSSSWTTACSTSPGSRTSTSTSSRPSMPSPILEQGRPGISSVRAARPTGHVRPHRLVRQARVEEVQ